LWQDLAPQLLSCFYSILSVSFVIAAGGGRIKKLQDKPPTDKRIKQSSTDKLADSILWIGVAIAVFFCVFSAFLLFLDIADFTLL